MLGVLNPNSDSQMLKKKISGRCAWELVCCVCIEGCGGYVKMVSKRWRVCGR